MTGEREIWFELSHDWGIPVQELKRKTSSRDFVRHMITYSRRREREATRDEQHVQLLHFFLAQIAVDVKRKLAKNPESIHIENIFAEVWAAMDRFKKGELIGREKSPEEEAQESTNAWMTWAIGAGMKVPETTEGVS
jgi:hypothetical protein